MDPEVQTCSLAPGIVLARTVRLGTGSMLHKSDVTSVRVADCIPASFFTSFHHLRGSQCLKCSTLAA